MSTALLLEILSHADDDGVRRRVASLTGADWQTLIDEAVFHEVEALLYHRFTSLDVAPAVPQPVTRLLQERYSVHALRNRLIQQELGTLLDALAAAGVRTAVLKGAYLAWCVYPDPALRSMGDVDVLVAAADLSSARDVLLALGYSPGPDLAKHHLPAMRKPGATTVEVHWTIERPSSPFTIDADGLLRRAVVVDLAGRATLALAPPDLLIHLALHIAYHHRFGIHSHEGIAIKHLYDVAAVLAHHGPAMDWAAVCDTANAWGAGRYVFSALGVVQRLFGAAMPPAYAGLEHGPTDDRIVEVMADSFLAPRGFDADGFSRWTRQRGLLDRVRYARRTLFPGLNRVAAMHDVEPGSGRAWLHAVLRPFRLAARYAGTTAHLQLRTPAGRAVAARHDVRHEVDRWIAAG